MVHKFHLGDKHVDSSKLLKEIGHYKQDFDNPANSNIAPDGYLTVEEFRNEAKKSLTKMLNEHGIC